jgi:ribonuclease III
MKDFSQFESSIGIQFKNKKLLEQAFTHRSYLNENSRIKGEHNERLEYLGDAVLELVVSEYLYKEFPDKPEGELTSYRAALVNTISISEASNELKVNDFLLLSRGEAKDTGKARQYILANTFEALIGASYLDQGYESAKKIIAQTLFPKLPKILEDRSWQDAKSYFQEKAQEVLGITPTYSVRKEIGPDHDKHFTMGVYLEDQMIAQGEGYSKQEAEQSAAQNALEVKKWK